VLSNVVERTWLGLVFFVMLLPFYYFLSPIDIPMTPVTWVAAFVLADFSYYWMHRIEHKVRILWANHSVHHSSEDYNLTVSLRIFLLDGVIEWIFLVPMILIGFNPFQTIMAFLLVVQYQSWIHTEHIKSLGFLDKILNTPSNHRVHHGSNQEYLDKNFGGFFILWDKLFGTYAAEEAKVVYGLTDNINTNNPLMINVAEYVRLYRDVKRCNSFKAKLRCVFGGLSTSYD